MNYEELYADLQPLEKDLMDKLNAMQKLLKAAQKDTENGDLKNLGKNLSTLTEAAEAQLQLLASLAASLNGFDSRAYFENGDFAGQMLEYCREADVDVKGDFPNFEMFPYRVRIDIGSQEISLDRKKLQCMRPASLVKAVKAGQEKLNRASFNEQGFVNELAEAYDMALLKFRKQPEDDVYLTKLYKLLAPMGRFRREYGQQGFAFDLARLYMSDVDAAKDGRRLQFGHSRDIGKAIRILDASGHEQFLSTIRFFK